MLKQLEVSEATQNFCLDIYLFIYDIDLCYICLFIVIVFGETPTTRHPITNLSLSKNTARNMSLMNF